jgi:hypothetical protein
VNHPKFRYLDLNCNVMSCGSHPDRNAFRNPFSRFGGDDVGSLLKPGQAEQKSKFVPSRTWQRWGGVGQSFW